VVAIVNKHQNNGFIRPLIISGLFLISQYLFSQINIKIVDEENNPIQFVQIFNKNTGALICISSHDGVINIEDSNISTISLFHPNFIGKTLTINNLNQNISVMLERKYTDLKEVEVTGNRLKNKTMVIEAYVRNYNIENDSLTNYLDAIVEYVILANPKEDNAKSFLKEYRILSLDNKLKKKKRWISLSISNVGVPNIKIKSILDIQKNFIQITNNIIYLKKYNDSIAGDINLRDGIFKVQMDKAVGDKSIHNFLGYRVKYLHNIVTENYNYSNFNAFSEIPKIKNLITKNGYQKILMKHKKDNSFDIIEKFSDIIILRYRYIELNEVKNLQKQRFSSDKSIYQNSFWINYDDSLPSTVKENLKNLVEL
jgi:hypothetical protein